MRNIKRVLVVHLAVLFLIQSAVPAFAVSAVPKAAQMRLRGVSFVGSSLGWVVGEGVLATTDGGKTWSRQFAPFEDLDSIDMGSSTQGCAVGPRGAIVRTSDAGAHWSKTDSGVTADLYDVDFVDGTHGWAVGDWYTVLRTVDGGITWTKCALPITHGYERRRILDVSFVDRYTGYVCGESVVAGDGFKDLYIAKTTNGGLTWSICSNGPYIAGGSDDLWAYSGIDFPHSGMNGFVCGTPGIMSTMDGGTSWVRVSTIPVDEIYCSRGSNNYAVAVSRYGGTAYYWLGGGTWRQSDLSVADSDPLKSLLLGDVCMTLRKNPWSVDAWTVAQSLDAPDVARRGLIAHSSDYGIHWTTQPSSTGPVFFLGGETRYDSAVNIAKLTDVPGGTVVLATGRDYPDALAASGLAGVMDATLLLTNSTLPAQVSKAIADLGADKVIIVGGEDVVSDSIRDALAKDYDVERIEGANRYETAANIARRMVAEGASPDEVFICCGTDYADAASASSLSYGRQIPILLVKPGELPYPTKRVLGELGVTDAYVVGSSVAVGNGVMGAIEDAATSPAIDAVRVANGVNRYSTSVLLASWASRKGWIDFDRVGIATGANFPDALTGGALMGSRGQTVLLTDPDHLSGATDSFVAGKSVDQVWIMNDRGTGAVQDPVGTRLAYLLR